MNSIEIVLTAAALLTALLFLLRKYPIGAGRKWRDPFAGFDEVVRGAEATNGAYFRALELMLKTLEAVRDRTAQAEQILRDIVARPGIEPEDRYKAAELLLAQGQQPAKIAALLHLPLSQIHSLLDPHSAGGADETPKAKKTDAGRQPLDPKGRIDFPSAPRTKKAAGSIAHGKTSVGAELFAGEIKRPRVNGSAE